jgi:hypothetical protein
MLSDLIYLPVNWIDGMKISRAHFQQTENYFTEQLRDGTAQQLTDYNFGILPAERSLDLAVFCDLNQQISVELNSCKAITPNGSRIQVATQDAVKINASFKDIAGKYGLQTAQSQNLYIIITVNPFERISFGEPPANENPPRHPHTRPDQRLDLVPAEYINSIQLANSLVIGKITYQNGELLFDKEFIPSCTAVNSMPVLLDWYIKFRQLLETWEQYCIRIIQKINSKTQAQQPNALATNIQHLSEKILEQLVLQKLPFQWFIHKSAPIYMCALLLQNIQYVFTVLKCYAEKDREELLNYFTEWTEIQAGSFDNQTLRVLQIQYNHYDTGQTLSEIMGIYDFYIQLFQKLAQLEFIGKRKGQNIFVIEQQVPSPNSTEKPNSRWSPLS